MDGKQERKTTEHPLEQWSDLTPCDEELTARVRHLCLEVFPRSSKLSKFPGTHVVAVQPQHLSALRGESYFSVPYEAHRVDPWFDGAVTKSASEVQVYTHLQDNVPVSSLVTFDSSSWMLPASLDALTFDHTAWSL